jgi:hypothetical protein
MTAATRFFLRSERRRIAQRPLSQNPSSSNFQTVINLWLTKGDFPADGGILNAGTRLHGPPKWPLFACIRRILPDACGGVT